MNEEEEARLRAQLQRAVFSEAAPPFLEARIRARLERPVARWPRLVAQAAAVLLLAGGGYLFVASRSADRYIQRVSAGVASIFRAGLGDHLHCAHFRGFAQSAKAAGWLAADLGPGYARLVPAVQSSVAPPLRIEAAHRCSYQGRTFVHVILARDRRLASLIVADKLPGESIDTSTLRPALTQAGLPIYRSRADQFEIAMFESQGRLVYLVSDLPEAENTERLRAMAAAILSILPGGQLHLKP